jgi:hypothetical protein
MVAMGGTNMRTANRAALLAGLGLIVVGVLGSLASLVLVWQSQEQLSGGATFTRGPSTVESGPTLADRITTAMQFGGGYLLFAAIVIGVGAGLWLAAAHLPDRRTVSQVETRPLPPVIEVPLEVEEQFWGSVGPRPDDDPFRR